VKERKPVSDRPLPSDAFGEKLTFGFAAREGR